MIENNQSISAQKSKKMSKINLFIYVFIAAIFFIMFWFMGLGELVNRLELVSYDWRARVATDSGPFRKKFFQADKSIILLSIDDYSYRKLDLYKDKLGMGRWPWPRETFGRVVNYLNEGNPKAIAFDIKFEGIEGNSKQSKYSDRYLSKSFENKNVILGIASTIPRSDDKKVIESLIRDNANNKKLTQNYLDFIIESYKKNNDEKLNHNIFLEVNDKEISSAPIMDMRYKKFIDTITFYDYSAIPDIFLDKAKAGVVNLDATGETSARHNVPLYRIVKKNSINYLPHLALATVLSVIPEEEKSPIVFTKDKLKIGNKREIPLNKDGKVIINWHGDGQTYKHFHIADVILSEAYERGLIAKSKDYQYLPAGMFKDKIIVIGQTAAGTDVHSTPMNYAYPGPEIIATLIDNYLNDANLENPGRRKFITKVPFLVNILIAILFCCAIGYFNLKSKAYYASFIFGTSVIIIYFLWATILFVHPYTRLWIDMVLPVTLMIFATMFTYILRLNLERANKQAVENMFGKFVSPQVLKSLLDSPDGALEGNKRKDMTVLFSDIRDFTTLSETVPADELFPQINEYFNEVVDIILSNNGTLDKFIGDAVMAFWGDPLHVEDKEYLAVKTAVEMIEKVEELNEKWVAEGKQQFSIGVGLNSGDMLVGYMGSQKLVDYTVVGDNVNLAARIESLTKDYKESILISDATYEKINDRVEAVYIDEVKVKGKKNAVKIYSVKGLKSENKINLTDKEAHR